MSVEETLTFQSQHFSASNYQQLNLAFIVVVGTVVVAVVARLVVIETVVVAVVVGVVVVIIEILTRFERWYISRTR